MFAMAARRMGYRVPCSRPTPNHPPARWLTASSGPYEDLAAVREFAASGAALTIEFETSPPRPSKPPPKSLPCDPARTRFRPPSTACAKRLPRSRWLPAPCFAVVRGRDCSPQSAASALPASSRRPVSATTARARRVAPIRGHLRLGLGRARRMRLRTVHRFRAEISVISVRGVDGETVT